MCQMYPNVPFCLTLSSIYQFYHSGPHGEWLKGAALQALISVAALHHDEPSLHVELEPRAAEAVALQPR